jgi:NAD(P)-dependent dehydrogenase (short-subunit alcohol dehydrogenase family)
MSTSDRPTNDPTRTTGPTASRRPVAVVTGASAGVGRATAIEFARRGYDVGLIARGAAGLQAAADDVQQQGGSAVAVAADIADHAAVDAAASTFERELGPIDVWVNNAMTTVFAPVSELSAAEIERATDVTYLGQVHGTLAALERMRPRDRGTIVFVGSALAYRGIPLQSAYCAAKFAVRGFHDSLRTELLHEGSSVRTTIVHLPAVNTPQFGWCRTRVDRHPMPVPPIYQPELIARRIVSAAQRPPRQRVIGAWNWSLIRLSQLMPGVADHYMAATGVEGQLTDEPIDPNRPDDLHAAVDDDRDVGAHGIFDERAHGLVSPSFLRTLPSQAAAFGRAVRDRWSEAIGRIRGKHQRTRDGAVRPTSTVYGRAGGDHV